jgi:hypothetical protein
MSTPAPAATLMTHGHNPLLKLLVEQRSRSTRLSTSSSCSIGVGLQKSSHLSSDIRASMTDPSIFLDTYKLPPVLNHRTLRSRSAEALAIFHLLVPPVYLAIALTDLGFWAPGLTELDLISTWSTQYPNRVAALPNALVCTENWNLAMMTFI